MIGLAASGRRRRPRISSTIRTGTTVIARIEESVMAKVLV